MKQAGKCEADDYRTTVDSEYAGGAGEGNFQALRLREQCWRHCDSVTEVPYKYRFAICKFRDSRQIRPQRKLSPSIHHDYASFLRYHSFLL